MNDNYPNSPRQRSERRRSAPQRSSSILSAIPMLTLVVAFGLAFLAFMGLKGCASSDGTESSSQNPVIQTEQTDKPVSSTEAPPVISSAEPAESSSGDTEPASSETETETVTESTEPAPAGPTMMTVDDRYFADALFLGDSRTDGLFLYSTPGDCKHYPFPATSMTIYSILDSKDENKRYGFATTRDLLKGMQFGKIYLMFGINEVGYSTASFAEKYKEVLDEIRLYQPDALIYIQSILYVTQNHELKYPVFATANIKEKNQAIQVLANDVDTFYLEVNDCLNDGTDHLPSDYTGDGAHLKASKYALWHDYLLQHAYVDDKHPWSPDAPTPEGAQIEHP